jgi:hypothetical protein
MLTMNGLPIVLSQTVSNVPNGMQSRPMPHKYLAFERHSHRISRSWSRRGPGDQICPEGRPGRRMQVDDVRASGPDVVKVM